MIIICLICTIIYIFRARVTVSADLTHKSIPTSNGHRHLIEAQTSASKLAKVKDFNIATDGQPQTFKDKPAKMICLVLWCRAKTGQQVKGT